MGEDYSSLRAASPRSMLASTNMRAAGLTLSAAGAWVPLEPTDAMLEAAWDRTVRDVTPDERMACELSSPKDAFVLKMRRRYRAMVSSAPLAVVDGRADLAWIAKAYDALRDYEFENGRLAPETELGRIGESDGSPAFRICAGHIVSAYRAAFGLLPAALDVAPAATDEQKQAESAASEHN
jgi:hypothetical protein